MPGDSDIKSLRVKGNSKKVKDDNLIIESCMARINEVFVRYRLQNIELTSDLLKNEWKNPARRIDFHSFLKEAIDESCVYLRHDVIANATRFVGRISVDKNKFENSCLNS